MNARDDTTCTVTCAATRQTGAHAEARVNDMASGTTNTVVISTTESKAQTEEAQEPGAVRKSTATSKTAADLPGAPGPLFKYITLFILLPILLAVSWFGCGFNLVTQTDQRPLNDFLLITGRFLYSLPLFCIMLLTLTGQLPTLASILSWKGWVPVSRLTFAAYLIQFVVIDLLAGCQGTSEGCFLVPYGWATSLSMCVVIWLWLFLIVFPALMVAAFLCYILIEKPSMNLRV